MTRAGSNIARRAESAVSFASASAIPAVNVLELLSKADLRLDKADCALWVAAAAIALRKESAEALALDRAASSFLALQCHCGVLLSQDCVHSLRREVFRSA